MGCVVVWGVRCGLWGVLCGRGVCGVWNVGFEVWGVGCGVQGSGFRVQGSGFRVQVFGKVPDLLQHAVVGRIDAGFEARSDRRLNPPLADLPFRIQALGSGRVD